MTATQVFILFLKQEFSPSEYIFFMQDLLRNTCLEQGGRLAVL